MCISILISTGVTRKLEDKGDLAAAVAVYGEALAMFGRVLDDRHWLVGNSRSHFGACLVKLGRYVEAEEHLLEARSILQESLGADHARTEEATRRLTTLYEGWGRPEEAPHWETLLAGKEPPDS